MRATGWQMGPAALTSPMAGTPKRPVIPGRTASGAHHTGKEREPERTRGRQAPAAPSPPKGASRGDRGVLGPSSFGRGTERPGRGARGPRGGGAGLRRRRPLTAMHCRMMQLCFMRPGPPNFFMSLQKWHSPHSVRRQASHLRHRVRRRRAPAVVRLAANFTADAGPSFPLGRPTARFCGRTHSAGGAGGGAGPCPPGRRPRPGARALGP